ncbi:hypothetical protein [Scatolibacter rhodanostii]|uniref:hypothetical protein n=1 Tax=Scatolibacter rhodanostii TaxID=2014781 RepID=UPI000C068572|nr:hypothetical protein [Scatolibacter rhodanostii]
MIEKIKNLGSKKRILLNIAVLAILLLIYHLTTFILDMNNLVFRHTVFIPFVVITVILAFLLTLQIINFSFHLAADKNIKWLLRILSGIGTFILSVFLILSLLFGFFVSVFAYNPEHVVEKDGKTMVAYVNSFLQVYVEYYDYVNPLVRGKQVKIMVDGGNGGYDPYKDGGEPSVKRYIYYDDNGNIIASTW